MQKKVNVTGLVEANCDTHSFNEAVDKKYRLFQDLDNSILNIENTRRIG